LPGTSGAHRYNLWPKIHRFGKRQGETAEHPTGGTTHGGWGNKGVEGGAEVAVPGTSGHRAEQLPIEGEDGQDGHAAYDYFVSGHEIEV